MTEQRLRIPGSFRGLEVEHRGGEALTPEAIMERAKPQIGASLLSARRAARRAGRRPPEVRTLFQAEALLDALTEDL